MREVINYMIEANIALLLFLVFYKLLLQGETHFRFQRFFVLAAMAFSLCFPLVHINNGQQASIPTISQIVPGNWLPEVVITGQGETGVIVNANKAYDFWQIAGWVYSAGVILFFGWLIIQLMSFLLTIRRADAYNVHQFPGH